jgi:hypothetical protein
MSQLLTPIFSSHRKCLEFANADRPYLVVRLEDPFEPTPIAGYSDPADAIDVCNELEEKLHISHVVYRLRRIELGWYCDYNDSR